MESENNKWKIGWGYTAACNMRCTFCYSQSARVGIVEVGLEKAKNFIDENAQWIESINFGTGECSLSDEWFELISYIHMCYPHIRQAITTNGSLAFRSRQQSGSSIHWASCINEVDISLDFAESSRHNYFRKNPNAYTWAIDTLQECMEKGKTTTLVFIGLDDTLSIENLQGLFSLAKQYMSFVRMNIYRPVNNNGLKPPAYENVMTALSWMFENNQVVSLCDPLFGSIFQIPITPPNHSNNTSLRILPNGNITPSTYLISEEWWAANIKNGVKLNEIAFSDPFNKIRAAPAPIECANCIHLAHCGGGAIDRRILHYRTLKQRDPYCPYRYSDKMPSPQNLNYYKNDISAPDIHDGYLPTLIFAPGRK